MKSFSSDIAKERPSPDNALISLKMPKKRRADDSSTEVTKSTVVTAATDDWADEMFESHVVYDEPKRSLDDTLDSADDAVDEVWAENAARADAVEDVDVKLGPECAVIVGSPEAEIYFQKQRAIGVGVENVAIDVESLCVATELVVRPLSSPDASRGDADADAGEPAAAERSARPFSSPAVCLVDADDAGGGADDSAEHDLYTDQEDRENQTQNAARVASILNGVHRPTPADESALHVRAERWAEQVMASAVFETVLLRSDPPLPHRGCSPLPAVDQPAGSEAADQLASQASTSNRTSPGTANGRLPRRPTPPNAQVQPGLHDLHRTCGPNTVDRCRRFNLARESLTRRPLRRRRYRSHRHGTPGLRSS